MLNLGKKNALNRKAHKGNCAKDAKNLKLNSACPASSLCLGGRKIHIPILKDNGQC